MFDHPKFTLFLAASAVLILTPGPAVLYIVARSISQGRRAGLISVAGIGVGNLTHALAAALGLSAILASSPLAFSALKYLGAAYLIFMGIRKFIAPARSPGEVEFRPEPIAATFKQGLTVGLLNPKTALFFLAFLPQFTAPGQGSITSQLLVFGLVFVVLGVIGDGTYALLAGTFGAWIKQRKNFLAREKYVAGVVYCALGIVAAVAGSGKGA